MVPPPEDRNRTVRTRAPAWICRWCVPWPTWRVVPRWPCSHSSCRAGLPRSPASSVLCRHSCQLPRVRHPCRVPACARILVMAHFHIGPNTPPPNTSIASSRRRGHSSPAALSSDRDFGGHDPFTYRRRNLVIVISHHAESVGGPSHLSGRCQPDEPVRRRQWDASRSTGTGCLSGAGWDGARSGLPGNPSRTPLWCSTRGWPGPFAHAVQPFVAVQQPDEAVRQREPGNRPRPATKVQHRPITCSPCRGQVRRTHER
jgi:hypothetical protein